MDDELPEGLEGSGYRTGDVAYNFTVIDQHGDEVELYQFYGQVVQLVLFAEWCGPCQAEAPELEAAWQDLESEGVVVLSVMMENGSGNTPGVDDLNNWVDSFDCTHPVLGGPADLFPFITTGYPTLPVLNRDMTIATDDLWPFDVDYLAALAAE